MMYKLKQCPFCGGKNMGIYVKGNEDKKFAVMCNNCDARAGRKKTKQAAAEEWNKRHKNEGLVEFDKYWLNPKEPKLGWCSNCKHKYACKNNTFSGICIMNIETRERPTAYEKEIDETQKKR